jgi:hypothetical protein
MANPDVRLHPEVPLVALLRLVHVGVALALGVLRRAGRSDDRGVHDGARAHQQALLGQVRVDLVEQRLGQVVGQQQAPKLQQRRGVGHRFARQVDAHEIAHRLAVVQGVFQRFVSQPVPLLQTVLRSIFGTPMGGRPTRPLRG